MEVEATEAAPVVATVVGVRAVEMVGVLMVVGLAGVADSGAVARAEGMAEGKEKVGDRVEEVVLADSVDMEVSVATAVATAEAAKAAGRGAVMVEAMVEAMVYLRLSPGAPVRRSTQCLCPARRTCQQLALRSVTVPQLLLPTQRRRRFQLPLVRWPR